MKEFSQVRFNLLQRAFGRKVAQYPARYAGESNLTEWRRGWDSNPRYGFPHARFRGECFQPLSHLSAVVSSLIVTEPIIHEQF